MEQNQETLISLYDYLGRAAGSVVVKQVTTAAVKAKEKIGRRFVSNARYKGEVLLYRREFLEMYFAIKEALELNLSEKHL